MALRFSQLGSTLVEILIATAIIGATLTAIAAALSYSVKTNAESKYRELATQQAQKLLEVFRREKALLGWDEFYLQLNSGVYCFNTLPDYADGFSKYSLGECSSYGLTIANSGVAFSREATVTKGADYLEVEVNVYWPGEGSLEHQVSAVQQFKKWQ